MSTQPPAILFETTAVIGRWYDLTNIIPETATRTTRARLEALEQRVLDYGTIPGQDRPVTRQVQIAVFATADGQTVEREVLPAVTEFDAP